MCVGDEPLPSPRVLQDTGFATEKLSRTVTRSDIAAAINRRLPKLSQRQSARMLDFVLQEIANALAQGEDCVKLHEFGTFYVRERAARAIRVPAEGESAAIRQRRTLNFRPSIGLKEMVENGSAQSRRRP